MSAMNLSAKMSLNARSFTSPLGKVRGMLGGTIGKMAMLTGGVASLAGVAAGLKKSLSFAADLDHLSKRTGATVGNLAILQQAFDDTGVGAQSAGELLNYMQRNLNMVDKEGKTANKGLKALGINLEEFEGMGTVEKFDSIGKKIMLIEDPAKRTAVAMDVFGRSGAKALQYFGADGAFDAAAGSLGSLPGLLDRSSAKFESIDTYMGRMKMKWTGLFTGVMSGLAPQLDGVMAKVDKVDFAGWGIKIADTGKLALAIFGSGKLGEVAGLGFEVAFTSALNFLVGPLSSLSMWKGIGQIALAAFIGIGPSLIKLFMMPVTYLQAGMDKAVQELYEGVGKIPGIGKAAGLEGFEADTFASLLKDRKDNGFFLETAINDSLAIAGALGSNGLANIQKSLANATDIFGVEEMKTQLATVVDEVKAGMVAAAPVIAEGAAAVSAKTVNAIAGKADAAGKTSGGGSSKAADSLAKIGGFIGGSSPQTKLARESNRLLKRIEGAVNNLNNGGSPVAVWGA